MPNFAGEAYMNLSKFRKEKKKKKKKIKLRDTIKAMKKMKEYKPTKIPQRYKGKNRQLMEEIMND